MHELRYLQNNTRSSRNFVTLVLLEIFATPASDECIEQEKSGKQKHPRPIR